MSACPRCGKEAVTQEWADEACPLQSAEQKAAIVAAGLCVPHTLTYFGHEVTHRGRALTGPVRTTVDGTIDRGRMVR